MVIETIKITLSIKNANDLIDLLQKEGAIEQELPQEHRDDLLNKMCIVDLGDKH